MKSLMRASNPIYSVVCSGGREVPFLQCLRTHYSIVIRQCTGGVVDCGVQVFVSKTNQVRIEVTGRLRGDGRTTDSATSWGVVKNKAKESW